MGELARARDAVYEAIRRDNGQGSGAEIEAAQDRYDQILRDYFLSEIDEDMRAVRQAVEDSHSSAAVVMLAWVTAILYKDRT